MISATRQKRLDCIVEKHKYLLENVYSDFKLPKAERNIIVCTECNNSYYKDKIKNGKCKYCRSIGRINRHNYEKNKKEYKNAHKRTIKRIKSM